MQKKQQEDRYIRVAEMQDLLGGVSNVKAYAIIRQLNSELKSQGYITIAGRVSRPYALKRLGITIWERRSNNDNLVNYCSHFCSCKLGIKRRWDVEKLDESRRRKAKAIR